MAGENIKDKSKITFGELALALANDYESVFVIDSDDDSYVEYIAEGNNKELVRGMYGDNFYGDVVHNCRMMVHPEDQELFLASFKKENVTEVLKNGKSFSLNYRLMKEGGPQHYFLKTIRGNDNKVIVGVRNVDEERKRELKANEEAMTYRHIAGALAGRYEAIYYINIKTNKYTQYITSRNYAKLGTATEGEDFFKDAFADIDSYIVEEDIERIKHEMDKSVLLENLKKNGSLSLIYRQQLGDEIKHVNMNIVYPRNDKDHIVMGVTDIDDQIRHEQTMQEENRTFSNLATALATRYEVIYHVDLATNEYSEYSANDKYAKLEVGTKGSEFFLETQKNMQMEIYPEDYPKMAEAMKKENLLASLEETGKVSINYRLILDGRPQYVTLIAIRPRVQRDHIIVAVENIDAAVRKEMEFEAAIGTAMDMANRDALTGVKNKRAYVQAEMQLDEMIGEGRKDEFAIAVCDINGLKQENDLHGHKAGDEFIKNACSIICNTFKHSPVFRVGGDEFVVILRGSDYENRNELFTEFAAKQAENKEKGLVTLAHGVSEFNAGKDIRVQDVFERADNLMYENKRRMKGEIVPEKSCVKASDPMLRFYELYEQLVSAMTDIVKTDVPKIENLLIEISLLFRLSKGVTRLYKNPQEEAAGIGETLCCFDTGKEGEEIISLRVVTSVMSSATLTVYMSPDEKPLTDEERWKVELVMRTTLSFVSRNRLRDMVEELTYFDEAGYPNLRSLNSFIMRTTGSGKIRQMAAVHYNLRHFSLVNKEFGMKTGDIVMKRHYNGLMKIIGEHGYIARLGGDNYVALFPKEKTNAVVDYLTEKNIVIDEGRSVSVTTSTGVFVVPDDYVTHNPMEIIGNVINAFRIAQGGGKDHIVFYDESLFANKEKKMLVQTVFPEALRDEEFKPFYQPKVNTMTGELVGAEALCRWFHEGKMIPPCDFIPILEETNDICKLDLYMLEHVCRDIRRLLDEGKKVVRISVNFSRKHMLNVQITDTIKEIIDRYNVPHQYIEVELTETTTDVEFSDLKRIANGLHESGIFTAVDDFGVGFSSLNLISEIPWNVLKIDRGFLPVETDDENSTRSVMFRHVVSMTRQLGLECVAEGVETRQQLEILRNNGCDIAQGFFFDRPLPVEDFEERLLRGKYVIKNL